jgi:hypothetical protein
VAQREVAVVGRQQLPDLGLACCDRRPGLGQACEEPLIAHERSEQSWLGGDEVGEPNELALQSFRVDGGAFADRGRLQVGGKSGDELVRKSACALGAGKARKSGYQHAVVA